MVRDHPHPPSGHLVWGGAYFDGFPLPEGEGDFARGNMSWIVAMPIDELRQKGPSLLRSGKKQIAVFEVGKQLFATDNRCPHEGYPLREGAVDENCVLTCSWHNWKFDLKSGENLLGMDNVRTYPTKLEEGQVWVDLSDPPRSAIEREVLRALEVAFDDRDYGRIGRQIAKLHFHGIDPLIAVRQAIEWSHQKFEFGMTHAYAATADWLELYDELENDTEARLTCLVEAIDHMAYDSLRRADYPYSAKEKPYSEEAFINAIELEQEEEAIQYLNGALSAPSGEVEFRELDRAFTRAALAHFNDFGHSLIYVSKVATLVDQLGRDVLPFLTRNLVRSLIYATREDLLPEFQKLEEHLSLYPKKQGSGTLDGDTPYGMTVNKALDWVVSRASQASVPAIYETLLATSARNLLHYDTKFDDTTRQPVTKNANWLFGTHALTFANAARKQCEKFPGFWNRALLQMACFVGRLRPFIDPQIDEEPWLVEEESAFLNECQATVLDHGLDPPIYSSHLIKTYWAIRQELQSETLERSYVLASLNRFFHSRLRQKHPQRTMHQSLALVGKDF